FRKVRVGQTFRFARARDGKLAWLRWEVGPTQIAHAYRDTNGSLLGIDEAIHLEKRVEFVSGEIEDGSLYLAMERAHERAALTMAFVDLFVWDIDFFTSTQVHDRFRMLVEKQYVDGRFIGYGRILGGEYRMAEGKTFRAFYYARGKLAGYYT